MNTLSSLLNFIGTRLYHTQKGSTQPVSVPAGSYKDVAVTFGATFKAVPTVMAVLYSTSTSSDLGSFMVSPINITARGFTARIFNNSSSARTPAVYWIAVD